MAAVHGPILPAHSSFTIPSRHHHPARSAHYGCCTWSQDHPSRHHPARSAHYGRCARSHTACPPASPSTYDARSKLQPDSTLLSPHPQSQRRVSPYSRSHSPSPTVVSSNNGASLFVPPSPTALILRPLQWFPLTTVPLYSFLRLLPYQLNLQYISLPRCP
jgi:hypothetical protein